MLYDHLSGTRLESPPQDADLLRMRSAGRQIAKTISVVPADRTTCLVLAKTKEAARIISDVFEQNLLRGPDGRWLAEQ